MGLALAVALSAGTLVAKTHVSPRRHTPAAAKSGKVANSSSKSSHTKTRTAGRHRTGKKSGRARGQQTIDSARATQIQQALIRENYLNGEPTGLWDQRTKDAIARYQADNGWQTKVLPDSRALIKLGLGPDHTNLINPDTAATAHASTTTAGKQ